MNRIDAKKIIDAFYEKNVHTQEEEFLFCEAMEYLIEETKEPRYMISLGGFYYERQIFDLALKYYDLAATFDYEPAYECLGYIWYYGRTGTKDYEKAFTYFSKAMEKGNLVSTYKIADMYKNGYYVEKDYSKYVSIIEKLYKRVKNCKNAFDPIPEILTRLARIRLKENKIEEGIQLYRDAKYWLSFRLNYSSFFGDLNIMKWLIQDLYKYTEVDLDDFDLFDLYHLLLKPITISFRYNKKNYIVQSMIEDDSCVIQFNDKWYRSVDDFFLKAVIDNKRVSEIHQDCYLFEVVE